MKMKSIVKYHNDECFMKNMVTTWKDLTLGQVWAPPRQLGLLPHICDHACNHDPDNDGNDFTMMGCVDADENLPICNILTVRG